MQACSVCSNPGLNQRALCDLFGIFPSRLVTLLDELAKPGFIERRDDPADRRSYRVYLTDAGRKAMDTIAALTETLDETLCKGLNEVERDVLKELLDRIVAEQGMTRAVHPAYKKKRRRS
jgi:MarR family transcriptional regulator, transcriptional regulator for hemolysin